jgi:hypothetical protein
MLGMADTAAMAAPPGPAAPNPAPRASPNKTMMGVALPGIAPLRAGGAPPHRPVAPQAPSRGAPEPSEVAIVPPPAPLSDLPSPPRLRIVRKAGVPLAAVALVSGGLVVVGGLAIALFYRGAPPIAVQPRVSPDGKDVLHLSCDPRSCKDGTAVDLDGAQATFASGECDLSLATPLRVGENPLALHIDRPGMGRDEVLKLTVPVAYRVRADVTTMSAPHPVITIRVDALPDSDVRIDDKPLSLDATGSGAYAVDESAATEGPADESRVVSVDLPYVVVPKGRAAETGTMSARVAVAPLRVDAPGARAVIEEDHVLVAGRAARGAQVTVDGAPVGVGPDGAFETTIALPAPGERAIEVRSGTAALMPRDVHLTVKRVSRLADEAKTFEQQKTIGYDAAAKDVAASVGQLIVVDGDVIESRVSGHRTLALVDDRRGCAKGPCKTRVIISRDFPLAPGVPLRAYGRVARAFAVPTGEIVPEVEADFALQPRR